MSRFYLLAGVGAGLLTGGTAMGQQMPGQFVGKPLVMPVGTQLPQAGTPLPRVGSPPPGYGGLTGSPYAPQTAAVDQKLVVAPYPTGFPGTEPKSFWDQVYDRWFGLFGLGTPTPAPRNWTPGLGRRNKERREAMWRRD